MKKVYLFLIAASLTSQVFSSENKSECVIFNELHEELTDKSEVPKHIDTKREKTALLKSTLISKFEKKGYRFTEKREEANFILSFRMNEEYLYTSNGQEVIVTTPATLRSAENDFRVSGAGKSWQTEETFGGFISSAFSNFVLGDVVVEAGVRELFRSDLVPNCSTHSTQE